MNELASIFNIGLLQNTLRTATPVVLCALGCLYTDHTGMMNIGVDGMMLIGSFAAVMGSWITGSWAMGMSETASSSISVESEPNSRRISSRFSSNSLFSFSSIGIPP